MPIHTPIKNAAHAIYWFAVGFILSGALLSSAVLIYFQHVYRDRSIPGVFVDNIYIGEKTKPEIEEIFAAKNQRIGESTFIFSAGEKFATVSAKSLGAGYDTDLITQQALNLGKSKSLLSDTYIMLASYINGTFLNSPYEYREEILESNLSEMKQAIYKEPVDAQFNVENNRVVAFRQASDGQDLDFETLHRKMKTTIPDLAKEKGLKIARIEIPIKVTRPKVTNEAVNNFGIVEAIGTGTSTFFHSIPGRIHNVALAASKMNGILVAPDEEFSFVKYLGDVSKYTGYKEAYVIQNGRTVLGDGGGICQVSTTLFRAILNAGLPITERHAHAYRVGYYEQDQPPGLDATVYVPSVDLKFKNDTGKHILIQAAADTTNLTLTFTLYGTSDGRQVTMTKPVISNVTAPPPDLIQDDPELPVGTLKQVDYAAPGGKSVFTRTVTRNGKVIDEDTFVSNYRAWQAVFLKGTKT